MSEFKKAPDAGSTAPLLAKDADAGGIAETAGLVLAAYWPTLLGITLFIAFKLAGKRLWGSICIGVLALLQLWLAGMFTPT